MALALNKPADYDDRVFLNCPFDTKFKPLFDAIVFTIHDLGFQGTLAVAAKKNKVKLSELKSWNYASDLQDLMASWILQNPS